MTGIVKKRSADETKAFGNQAFFEVKQYTDSGNVCDFNPSAVDFLRCLGGDSFSGNASAICAGKMVG